MWPQASAAFVGLRDGMLSNPGLLYRAAIEGSTFALQHGIDLCVLYDAFVLCSMVAPLQWPKLPSSGLLIVIMEACQSRAMQRVRLPITTASLAHVLFALHCSATCI